MTILFTVLFFASVLGVSIAVIWSVVDEHLDLVLANMPWKARRPAYCATPSISSETPSIDRWTAMALSCL